MQHLVRPHSMKDHFTIVVQLQLPAARGICHSRLG
jgi:hypothetical protein